MDGAQSAPHIAIDVHDLDVHFFAFSGHKMLGPTGIGVLYGKEEILNQMSPVEFGGEMIDFVYEQSATWKELPWKFEAGNSEYSRCDWSCRSDYHYLNQIGMDRVREHEEELITYLWPKLKAIPGLTIYGSQDVAKRTGLVAFNLDHLHLTDVATALDYEGVAVRAGHHCAQPLLKYLQVPATVGASLYIYNTKADCDKLVEALIKTKEFFNGPI